MSRCLSFLARTPGRQISNKQTAKHREYNLVSVEDNIWFKNLNISSAIFDSEVKLKSVATNS